MHLPNSEWQKTLFTSFSFQQLLLSCFKFLSGLIKSAKNKIFPSHHLVKTVFIQSQPHTSMHVIISAPFLSLEILIIYLFKIFYNVHILKKRFLQFYFEKLKLYFGKPHLVLACDCKYPFYTKTWHYYQNTIFSKTLFWFPVPTFLKLETCLKFNTLAQLKSQFYG